MNKFWETVVGFFIAAGILLSFIIAACFFAFFFSLVSGTIFYFLWNWLVPIVWAGAPTFSWLQAIGMWFLLGMIGRLLFGRRTSN